MNDDDSMKVIYAALSFAFVWSEEDEDEGRKSREDEDRESRERKIFLQIVFSLKTIIFTAMRHQVHFRRCPIPHYLSLFSQ